MKNSITIKEMLDRKKAYEKYAIPEFTNTVKTFFETNFSDSVNIVISTSASTCMVPVSKELAKIFNAAFRLDRGGKTLNIHIRNDNETLSIIIGTKHALPIRDEERANLESLAREADVALVIAENAVVLQIELVDADVISVSAINRLCPFYRTLEEVFFD